MPIFTHENSYEVKCHVVTSSFLFFFFQWSRINACNLMKYAAVKELLCIVISLCVYVSNKVESVVTFQEWKEGRTRIKSLFNFKLHLGTWIQSQPMRNWWFNVLPPSLNHYNMYVGLLYYLLQNITWATNQDI